MKKTLLKTYIILSMTPSLVKANTDIIWRTGMASAITGILFTNVLHADEFYIDGGASATNEDVVLHRLGFKWDMKSLFLMKDLKLDILHDVRLNRWVNNKDSNDVIGVFDYAPVFRLKYLENYYVECATGVSALSDKKLNGINYGGKFAFNHYLGAGVNIADFSLSVKYQHYSNYEMFEQNPGVNFYMLGLSYKY